jgi:exodeoxyribonuclease-1
LQTYLFYDLETTGLNKAFDQILHFAAIRTDLDFNEIDRYEIKVRLNPDVTPSPYAMLTHHMRLEDIAKGVGEYDAVKQIHKWINEPGTISLGYNTLSFDDEFLRFSFYRNLLPPYTHQFANQCSRMDIYPMTLIYFLFKNSIMKWPVKDGKASFKLEEINNINQFVSGRAHHAMVDVEATLALAKVLAQEKEMWDYVTGYFSKKTDQERLLKLESDTALMVLGKFGSDKKFQSIVLSLGPHYHYSNQLLWLRLDDKDFREYNKETILENTFVMNKKLGEPGFILPLKERFMQHINPEHLALVETNKQWLLANPDIFKMVSDHYRNYKHPALPATDIDASLYLNGFWTSPEDNFCKKFSIVHAKDKAHMAETVSNPKLYALALRILGRNFPEVMSEKQKEEFAVHVRHARVSEESDAAMDFKGKRRLTPKMALQQIAELRDLNQTDNEKLTLLQELETELMNICNV